MRVGLYIYEPTFLKVDLYLAQGLDCILDAGLGLGYTLRHMGHVRSA